MRSSFASIAARRASVSPPPGEDASDAGVAHLDGCGAGAGVGSGDGAFAACFHAGSACFGGVACTGPPEPFLAAASRFARMISLNPPPPAAAAGGAPPPPRPAIIAAMPPPPPPPPLD
eukprot:CAMPEP_0184255474 /NCGR_PEP_ID=MMETSP0977-20130417/8100_1 /TAXON_ID=483370 /ORGANISM="non described non described, Strain CCMP2097" /LENGTH=117 /DNA_ID=CAMNT_0026561045 /DNA_START=97 /DNA_END=447 /DNA_ORIENTATION=-